MHTSLKVLGQCKASRNIQWCIQFSCYGYMLLSEAIRCIHTGLSGAYWSLAGGILGAVQSSGAYGSLATGVLLMFVDRQPVQACYVTYCGLHVHILTLVPCLLILV